MDTIHLLAKQQPSIYTKAMPLIINSPVCLNANQHFSETKMMTINSLFLPTSAAKTKKLIQITITVKRVGQDRPTPQYLR